MTAIGELIIYFIYFILGVGCLMFLVLTITSKKSKKVWMLIPSLLFGYLLFSFKSWQDDSYKKNQLNQVGVYYLTNYHGCNSCYIELKENMTYIVINNGKIIERSNWHYEVGGDYWITYLNNDEEQLGSGEYSYSRFKLKYSDKSINQ